MDRVLIGLWVAAVVGYVGFAIIRRLRKKDSSREAGSDGAAALTVNREGVMTWMLWMATAAMGEMVEAATAVAEIEIPSNRRRAGPVRRA